MAEAKGDRRDENLSWNRVGQFLESTGAVGISIWQRNVDLWNSVSRHMRDDRYTADDVAKDAAKTMTVAMDNLDDMWSLWARVPDRERVAAALPTVFLFFDRTGKGGAHALVDPVLIRLPATQTEGLPERAEIVLGGQSTKRGGPAGEEGDNQDNPVDLLLHSLRARLDKAQGYWVETVADDETVAALVAGAYDGFVYLTRPARPLASLRVVVEGPPPRV